MTADDQLLQVGRPAAARAARQAASRQAPPENMAPAATQRGSEPTSSRRLRRSRRRGMRQKDTPCRCCRQERQVVTQERSTSCFLLLHLPLLLPHKVLRAVDPRARGAETPDPCA